MSSATPFGQTSDSETQPLVGTAASSSAPSPPLADAVQLSILGGRPRTSVDVLLPAAPGQQLLELMDEEVFRSAVVTRQASIHPQRPAQPPLQPPARSSGSYQHQPTPQQPGSQTGDGRRDPSGGGSGKRVTLPPPPASDRRVRDAVKAAVTGGQRTWLQVTAAGAVNEVQLDRFRIQAALGVQLRDFRILDPTLSEAYPPCILCRESAIVLNLLTIKVIITASCVLLRHAEMDKMGDFIVELQRRVQGKGMWSRPSLPDVALAAAMAASSITSAKGKRGFTPVLGVSASPPSPSPSILTGLVPGLAFELKALEVCLEQVVSVLTARTTETEAAAKIVMEQLTLKVNAANLERVRRIKSHSLSLSDDVSSVRSVLDKLMDSEKDMRALALTARAQLTGHQGPVDEILHGNKAFSQLDTLVAGGSSFLAPSSVSGPSVLGLNGMGVLDEEDNVAVVEMLVEAYTLQLANILRRLATLKEFILDTESLLNLELDQQRNNLIAMELTLTFGSLVLGSLGVVVGLFGTNTVSGLEDSRTAFVAQAVLCTLLTFAVWAFFCVVARAKGLRASWLL